jgi:[ribosomal protein S5]-alanine N-acetyltransferase
MTPIPVPAFSTQRLHMRPLCEADEALYCHLYTDPDVMRHIAAPLSVEAAQRGFHAACRRAADAASSMHVWSISEHAASAGIGVLARIRHADAADEVELGIMLRAEGQGRGFSAEALAALTDFAFDTAPLRRVWTRQAPGNAAVVGLMYKLGFVRTDEGNADAIEWRWQVTRERWRAMAKSDAW